MGTQLGEVDILCAESGEVDILDADPGEVDTLGDEPGEVDMIGIPPGEVDMLRFEPDEDDMLVAEPGEYDLLVAEPDEDDILAAEPGKFATAHIYRPKASPVCTSLRTRLPLRLVQRYHREMQTVETDLVEKPELHVFWIPHFLALVILHQHLKSAPFRDDVQFQLLSELDYRPFHGCTLERVPYRGHWSNLPHP